MSVLGWSGSDLRKIFSGDGVLLDNYLFKLHHQLNFFLVFFGAVFITGMNYLNDDSIICTGDGADKYASQYCWLHGSGHLPKNLADHMPQRNCVADQEETDDRHTHYYLWIPFVLGICMIVIKAPRILWNEVFERGLVQGAVQIANEESGEKERKSKLAERFEKLRGRAKVYGASYFLCEFLNAVSVMICFSIVDSLLEGKFWYYGQQFLDYDKEVEGAVNPLCRVFPTGWPLKVYPVKASALHRENQIR